MKNDACGSAVTRFGARALAMMICLVLSNWAVPLRVAVAAERHEAPVTFELKLPADLPKDARLFAAGNHATFGGWMPGVVEVPRAGTRSTWTVKLPVGFKLEYKFTLGDWDRVEVSAVGDDIANRVLTVPDGKTTLRIAIPGFKSFAPAAPRPSSRTGDIRLHESFPSRHVASRTLWIYLPPGYESEPQRRYPVIYMHDGNNCFDAAGSFAGSEWGVDETFEQLIPQGRLPKVIVVGVANTGARMDEYTMVPSRPEDGRGCQGGKADAYASFLIEEVKAFVDATYRTRPDAGHTAVMGSSLGGLVSFYLGIRHPRVFGTVGAVSPCFWWGRHWMTNFVRHHAGLAKHLRIWIDMGTAEDPEDRDKNGVSDLVDDVHDMAGLLLQKGFDRERIGTMIDDGAVHNEKAWAKRLPQILEFICRPWLEESQETPAAGIGEKR